MEVISSSKTAFSRTTLRGLAAAYLGTATARTLSIWQIIQLLKFAKAKAFWLRPGTEQELLEIFQTVAQTGLIQQSGKIACLEHSLSCIYCAFFHGKYAIWSIGGSENDMNCHAFVACPATGMPINEFEYVKKLSRFFEV